MADDLYVRRDVYDANREANRLEREGLAEKIRQESSMLARDLAHVRDDIAEINDRIRWLLRTVVTTAIMLFGNFVFLLLTGGIGE